MATGSWDPMAAGAALGRFRASDADRDRVIDALKAAFVQGRLTKDEFGMRTGQALAARTHGELTVITADIPTGLIAIQRPSQPARVRAQKRINKKAVAWAACVITLSAALGAAFLTYYGGFLVVFLFAFIGMMVSATPSAPRRPGSLPSGGRR